MIDTRTVFKAHLLHYIQDLGWEVQAYTGKLRRLVNMVPGYSHSTNEGQSSHERLLDLSLNKASMISRYGCSKKSGSLYTDCPGASTICQLSVEQFTS